ncbi:general transcriptional corepressor trfA-like [Aricia agestis]|uniref:general transcriptional corepressor trfA-like n=1 Tax=Aricia agestis TaxID=91739 RepID=UPI001C2028A1|nr:general transcriptional corepressor trfA-like [Aricia agestis]
MTADALKGPHHRRSAQGNLPSKGGWRPVVGSGGIYYGPLGTAPLHSSYKVPLLDVYQSSMRPIATRDVTKLSSIAQSYRPTTLRTVPAQTAHPGHQPINSYLNPFALPNNGLTHYKFVPNYQTAESVLIRNPHNQYRPIQKHQTKQKPQYHNNILQQLTNVQQFQFGAYSTGKPLDLFAAPIEYKPEKRPASAETEIYKPEVYKISESESSPQFVKTAQQQGGQKIAQNPYAQYSFHDLANFHQFPPSILGTFGSFGVQSVKGRDPIHQVTKTSFLQAQPTKHTIFNSFGYTPTFKTTPAFFSSTTPKLQTVPNHLLFGSGFGNFATQQTKLDVPLKIDPNAGIKNGFKPSPHDAFTIKNYNVDINKVTTYNPPLIQSTTPLYFNDYGAQANGLLQNYNNQQNINYNNKINNKNQQGDSVGLTQQLSQQYVDAPDALNLQNNQFNNLYHPYEVVENEQDELKTQSPWTVTPETFQNQDSDGKQDEADNNIYEKPTTSTADQQEEFAIVTESEKDFDNGFNYNQADSQSRRPLGDDFEPIGKQKLKDYYYRVSTPAYNGNGKSGRRTKKPNESVKPVQEITTEVSTNADNTDASSAPLPTLPPNLHFKRPSSNDTSVDKDKIRKRNKIRRRRPQLANLNRNKTETVTLSESSTEPATTIADEVHTIRPRPRTTKTSVTTQTITTDFTTSALPTTSPTRPTVIKKKLVGHRRPFTTTTTEKYETTTPAVKEHDYSRESPIMKISTRPHYQKTTPIYDLKINDTPDYSHKQDEKDTPTSDVSVSLSDTLKTSSDIKEFSFHRDARPVEMKETTESVKDNNDAETSQKEDTSPRSKLRPRLKNKFDRPKFSMKDYRSRLNSTTTTEKPTENTSKPRVSIRKPPSVDNYFTEVETTTERKKFMPKEPRHKLNRTDNNESEIHSRQAIRQNSRPNVEETETAPPQKISARIRNGQRRPKPTEESESTSPTTLLLSKRPLRKKVYDSDVGESVNDIVTENHDHTSERTRSESAIMKIADKKHHDHAERVFEQSKRVSDLTLAASKDYNTPGMFKTVAANSRRIPSYFTIATDDPILPIEAFFPQLNQKKEA